MKKLALIALAYVLFASPALMADDYMSAATSDFTNYTSVFTVVMTLVPTEMTKESSAHNDVRLLRSLQNDAAMNLVGEDASPLLQQSALIFQAKSAKDGQELSYEQALDQVDHLILQQ